MKYVEFLFANRLVWLFCLVLWLNNEKYIFAQIHDTTPTDLVYLINILRTKPDFFADHYLSQFSLDTASIQILDLKKRLKLARPSPPFILSRGLTIAANNILNRYPDTAALDNLPIAQLAEWFARQHPGAKRVGWQTGAGSDNPLETICRMLLYKPTLANQLMNTDYSHIGVSMIQDSSSCLIWLAGFALMPIRSNQVSPPINDCPPGTKIRRKRRF